MSWRIVVISKRAKLDYQMGCMVVRNEEEKPIFGVDRLLWKPRYQ